jgi:CO/xanthine dehydrogenase FAD-binding subunit
MLIQPDELLTKIRLPRKTANSYHYYRKVGTRKAQAISKVCLAAVGRNDNESIEDVRIAFGSVAPIVIRCTKTEDALRGQLLNQTTIGLGRDSLSNEIKPIDDIRSTSSYRLRVALNLLADFLNNLKSAS